MASDRPWFACYAADLITSDKWLTLSPAQRGLYMQLLAHQWLAKGHGFEDDDWGLFLKSGAAGWIDEKDGEWGGLLARLDSLFPKGKDGRRRNPRLHEEWQKSTQVQKAKSEGGKHGAQVRWGHGDK